VLVFWLAIRAQKYRHLEEGPRNGAAAGCRTAITWLAPAISNNEEGSEDENGILAGRGARPFALGDPRYCRRIRQDRFVSTFSRSDRP